MNLEWKINCYWKRSANVQFWCYVFHAFCVTSRQSCFSQIMNWVICCIFFKKGHSSWEIMNVYCLRLYSIITKMWNPSLKIVLLVDALGILSSTWNSTTLAFWHLREGLLVLAASGKKLEEQLLLRMQLMVLLIQLPWVYDTFYISYITVFA